jgi:hypothetical protein
MSAIRPDVTIAVRPVADLARQHHACRMTETPNSRDAWQSRLHEVVWKFGEDLSDLHQANPWPDRPLLSQAINCLMTELWDKGFSQSEICEAFNAAVADMPQYAAGEERRS